MTSPLTITGPDSTAKTILERLRGGLIVSCQARPGEPLFGADRMAAMAAACAGGGKGVRVNGVDDVTAVRAVVQVPVIGLWKDGDEGVYITPTTLEHALAVAAAGADVVALDATARPRREGLTLATTVR